MDYITCETRKNAPKINVLICEKKCQHAKTCPQYLNYLQVRSAAAVLAACPAEGDNLLAIKEAPQQTAPLITGK